MYTLPAVALEYCVNEFKALTWFVVYSLYDFLFVSDITSCHYVNTLQLIS